jgi:YD repeat-containing protein
MARYPATGNLVSAVVDVGGIAARTQYGHDRSGLLASSVNPMGTITEFAYDDAGNCVATLRNAGPGGLRQTTTVATSQTVGGTVLRTTSSLCTPSGKLARANDPTAR